MNARTYLTAVLKAWFFRQECDPYGSEFERRRMLGAMDAALVLSGWWKPGVSFEYKNIEYLGVFGRKKVRKETYAEHVVRHVGEYLAQPSGWHSRDELPPLSQRQVDKGDNGGFSRKLIFRHSSGKLSWGSAVLHEGKVAWWFPGDMDDIASIPEAKDEKDPIVSWALVPDVQQIADLIA